MELAVGKLAFRANAAGAGPDRDHAIGHRPTGRAAVLGLPFREIGAIEEHHGIGGHSANGRHGDHRRHRGPDFRVPRVGGGENRGDRQG